MATLPSQRASGYQVAAVPTDAGNKTGYRKWVPYLIIVGAFALLALIFSYPALQGKVLTQHDNLSWQAMSREASAYHDSTGINTLWSNSMFGGMPTYTYYVPESHNFMGYAYDAVTHLLPKPANFFLLAMLCFFALTEVLKINRWLGAIGAIAFAFSSYNPIIVGAGHETKMYAIAFMPLVLAGIVLLFRGRYLTGAALTGVAFAMECATSHYQIIFYMGIILMLAMLSLFILALVEGDVKKGVVAGIIGAFSLLAGLGTTMVTVLPTQEYAKETMRGGGSQVSFLHDKGKQGGESGGLDKEYAFRWSNGIGETFCILVPYLYGGASAEPADKMPETSALVGEQADRLPGYWGAQPSLSGPVYFGAIVCFLFVLGLLVVRSPHKWWILAASIIGIVMSWGNNAPGINYWLFDHVSQLNKFRTPSMILAIPAFLFPVLGIWAVHDIVNGKSDRATLVKSIFIAAGITGGLALILGLGGSLFFDFTNRASDANYGQILDALKTDRAAMARNSGLLSAVYIALAAGLLWMFAKDRINRNILFGGLAFLILADLMPVAHHYLNDENYADADTYADNFKPRQVDQQILQLEKSNPYYRVFDISGDAFNNAIPAYYHKLIGGYSPAKLEIMQDLIDVHMSKGITQPVLDMLNTKYLIVPAGQQGEGAVYPNKTACGNAWFVNEAKLVSNADQEILALNGQKIGDTVIVQNGFDPLRTAVIRNDFAKELSGYTFGKDSSAVIRLTKYGLNDLSFATHNAQNGLAVFSDIWYPHGWEASIDGKPATIIRANYVLRALKIPAGDHKVEFHFRPKSFEQGNTISMITSLALICLGIAAIVVIARNRNKLPEADANQPEVKA